MIPVLFGAARAGDVVIDETGAERGVVVGTDSGCLVVVIDGIERRIHRNRGWFNDCFLPAKPLRRYGFVDTKFRLLRRQLAR